MEPESSFSSVPLCLCGESCFLACWRPPRRAAVEFWSHRRNAGGPRRTDAAQRGLSLGRLREGEAAAASRNTPHVDLAELYLALQQRDQVRRHALAGYERAWGR
jgi:hypothetical protein